jgi:predicted methyltransferase
MSETSDEPGGVLMHRACAMNLEDIAKRADAPYRDTWQKIKCGEVAALSDHRFRAGEGQFDCGAAARPARVQAACLCRQGRDRLHGKKRR